MAFKSGDAIVHPLRGAGIVVRVEERQWHGSKDMYYRIELLGQPGSSLMIPIEAAKKIGVRRAISRSKLNHVWRVLRANPQTLPDKHKERYQLLEDKLHAGDIFEVAEVVRDMAWRQQREGRLTTLGKRMYEEGLMLLAGEVAAAQGVDLADAEAEVKERLKKTMSPAVV